MSKKLQVHIVLFRIILNFNQEFTLLECGLVTLSREEDSSYSIEVTTGCCRKLIARLRKYA